MYNRSGAGVSAPGAKRNRMLLRHRGPRLDPAPHNPAAGHEHLAPEKVAVLRWLSESRVEFVLVGSVATAMRDGTPANGPVAIVPAPYGRNLDRLSRALTSAHARMRIDTGSSDPGEPDTMPVKMNAEKLLRGPRWPLQCGVHKIDIEGRGAGLPRYQELLYEAKTFELDPGLKVQVASPEDIEHYVDRRAAPPSEIKISRAARTPAGS
jgi:hypothetical protein